MDLCVASLIPLSCRVLSACTCVSFATQAHCLPLVRQVVGDWTFHRTKANSQAKDMSTCNRAGSYLGGGDFGLGEPNYKVDDKIKVSLRAPNKASAVIDGKKVEGSWTMMYDEGFEVNLGGAKVCVCFFLRSVVADFSPLCALPFAVLCL